MGTDFPSEDGEASSGDDLVNSLPGQICSSMVKTTGFAVADGHVTIAVGIGNGSACIFDGRAESYGPVELKSIQKPSWEGDRAAAATLADEIDPRL
jgi:hypothetical protein